MIKLLLSAAVCFVSLQLFAQQKPVIKYYDSAWAETPKQSAFYYAEFNKEGNLYKCTAYWVNPKRLNGVGYFTDTTISQPRKLMINYYENGQMQDSSWYDNNGQPKYAYHYHQNGKLLARNFYDVNTGKQITEGFDANGKIIKGFIYAKEADYPDGESAWLHYMSKNVNTQVPTKNGAPKGQYSVVILFVVGKNGDVVDMKPETSHGYGMEEEVMRVLRNSPKWNPLIYLGEAKNAYRRQPITFIVEGK